MENSKAGQQEIVLPKIGMSRWSDFAILIPFSRETFRKLSLRKKAPQPMRLGVRCTFYRNEDIHRFLENPLEFDAELCKPIAS